MNSDNILTLTLNPAVDHILSIDSLNIYAKNIIAEMHTFYGGKGINVAYTLGKLNCKCTATGFLGNSEFQAFNDKLSAQKVDAEFIPIAGPTRANIKVMDTSKGKDTEFNQKGFSVQKNDLPKLFSLLDKLFDNAAWLAISGSLPGGVAAGIYQEIILLAKQHGIKICLDTSGPALQAGAAAKPTLLRINRAELEEINGKSLDSIPATISAIKKLTSSGIDMAVISMGGQGVLADDGSSTLFAKVPEVNIKSLTGAGDTLTAGFLNALTTGKTFQEALLFSSALATASILKLEPGDFATDDLNHVLKKTSIKVL